MSQYIGKTVSEIVATEGGQAWLASVLSSPVAQDEDGRFWQRDEAGVGFEVPPESVVTVGRER